MALARCDIDYVTHRYGPKRRLVYGVRVFNFVEMARLYNVSLCAAEQELGARPYDDNGVPSVIEMTGKKKIKIGQRSAIGKKQDMMRLSLSCCQARCSP